MNTINSDAKIEREQTASVLSERQQPQSFFSTSSVAGPFMGRSMPITTSQPGINKSCLEFFQEISRDIPRLQPSKVGCSLKKDPQLNKSSNSHFNKLELKKQELIKNIQQFGDTSFTLNSEADLESLEINVQKIARELSDLLVAIELQRFMDSEKCKQKSQEIVRSCPMKRIFKGKRLVTIRFVGGTEIELEAAYWARKAFDGKRGKGIYPGFYILGIHDHCSPLLVSEISMIAVAVGSFEEASHMLRSHGCNIDAKTIIKISKRFSIRTRLGQEAKDSIQKIDFGNVAGRKVVISTDGGRLRVRKPKKDQKQRKIGIDIVRIGESRSYSAFMWWERTGEWIDLFCL